MNAIVEELISLYVKDPDEGEALAREYGLWDALYESIYKPLLLRVCAENVDRFIEYISVDPETGDYVEQQPFHSEWQQMISEGSRVLIAAPRGHGKSVQVIDRVVWELGKNANLRVKIIGSSDEKAKENLGLIRDTVDKNPRVQEVFPNLLIDKERGDTKSAFFVVRDILQRDPSVEASGVLSAGAGGRADLLVCDDIVDLKNAVTNPAMREQVINAVKETWFSLVASTGKIVWICTPYHVADASHNLRDTGAFKVWWTPAVRYEAQAEENGDPIIDPETHAQLVVKKVLWPDKWSEEKLAEREKEVGPRVYARQYLLNAMSDEERTFPEKALEQSFDRSRSYLGEDIDPEWPTYGGVDLAAALGRKNAWTVIWTLAKDPSDNRLHLKEIYRRRMSFPDTIEAIIQQYQKHHWRIGLVENNAYQQAAVDAVREKCPMIPIESFTTGANKADEKVGLPAMAVGFHKSEFVIPAAKFPLEPDDPSDLAIVMNELRTHPGGEFSDTIMALWFAWTASKRSSGDFEEAWMAAQAA
jgi:hypothetical protein